MCVCVCVCNIVCVHYNVNQLKSPPSTGEQYRKMDLQLLEAGQCQSVVLHPQSVFNIEP